MEVWRKTIDKWEEEEDDQQKIGWAFSLGAQNVQLQETNLGSQATLQLLLVLVDFS